MHTQKSSKDYKARRGPVENPQRIKKNPKASKKLNKAPHRKSKSHNGATQGNKNRVISVGKPLGNLVESMRAQRVRDNIQNAHRKLLEYNQQTLHESATRSWALSNPTSSGNSLKVKLMDFFDSPVITAEGTEAYQQYLFSVKNVLGIDTDAAVSANGALSVVESFELYALPQFDLNTSNSSVMVLFGVPVQLVGTGAAGTGSTVATKSTLLTPTAVSDWVKVGSWNRNQLFDTTLVQPAYSGNGSLMCLGSFVIVDPDTGDLFPDGSSGPVIQYMARISVSQVLPQILQATISIPQNGLPCWDYAVTTSQPANKSNLFVSGYSVH